MERNATFRAMLRRTVGQRRFLARIPGPNDESSQFENSELDLSPQDNMK